MQSIITALTQPACVWSRAEVLSRPCPVPRAKGVYAWFFRDYPSIIPAQDCVRYNELTLLYIGISPREPSKDGRASPQNLRNRIRQHYNLNAEGSTLRLSLGVLLEETLGIQLRRVGSGTRKTFHTGETVLSQWMAENAFVTWLPHEAPWVVEHHLIGTLSLPLNLDKNKQHPFNAVLSRMRSAAKQRAKELPIV